MVIDEATLVMQFLALYESGKNAIYWESPISPFAGHCGYERLINKSLNKQGAAFGDYCYSSTSLKHPFVNEYDPDNSNHAEYVCLGCAERADISGAEVASRVKYHFEPMSNG